MKPIRIAFGHKAGVGKDTAGEILAQKFGAKVIRFAKPLYDCLYKSQEILGVPQEKNRYLLQTMGEAFRQEYGENIFVNCTLSGLKESQNYVCVDLRYKNEANALKKLGFILVKIERNTSLTDSKALHKSEIDLDNYPFDFVVNNSGTLEEFEESIFHIIKNNYAL